MRSKGRAGENALKKGRATKGGVRKRTAMAAGTGQPITTDDGRSEVGAIRNKWVEIRKVGLGCW